MKNRKKNTSIKGGGGPGKKEGKREEKRGKGRKRRKNGESVLLLGLIPRSQTSQTISM